MSRILRAASREWSLVAAALLGAFLRLDQIGIQIPLDDEWHALHAVERFGYVHVLTHFGWTDYCIPLTLFDKIVSDVLGLSELWMRLPVLGAGIASLIVLPLTVRPWVGRDAAATFAWLLAVSPLHVYLSRYARPYSIALLLTWLALFALLHVQFLGRPRWAWVYVAAAVFAPYFHLTTLPLVLLPLAIAWLGQALGGRGSRFSLSGGDVRFLSAGVGLGLLVLIGPPLLMDHQAILYKAGRGAVDVSMLGTSAQLVAGSARAGVLAFFALAAIAGCVALARSRAALALYLGLVAVIGAGVPLLSHPVLVNLPIVVVRYALILLPVTLLLVACGCASVAAWAAARTPRVGSLVAPLLAGILLAEGPLPHTYWRPNAWTNHPAYQYSYASPPCDTSVDVPPFYHWLARFPPGSQRVVEAPWLFAAAGNHFHCYQRVHRQHMLVGFVGGAFDATGALGLPRPGELPVVSRPDKYRLRTFVHVGAADDLQRRGVRFVILHKSIDKEMAGAPTGSDLGALPWIERYREVYGPPVYEDGMMAAFDVASGPGRAHP